MFHLQKNDEGWYNLIDFEKHDLVWHKVQTILLKKMKQLFSEAEIHLRTDLSYRKSSQCIFIPHD